MDQSVAVIIPCGGSHTKYVDEAVESCLKADPRPREIAVVDDCSSPPIGMLLAQMNGNPSGLSLHKLQRHQGRSCARNYAVKQTNSDWLYFLDADDLLEPTAISDFWTLLKRTPNLHLAYADYDYLDEFGNRHRVEKQPWGRSARPLRMGGRNPVNIGMFVRRDRFKLIGGFDEEVEFCGYWDMFLRYAMNPIIQIVKNRRPFFVARSLSVVGDHATELIERGSKKVRTMIRGGYYQEWSKV